VNKVLPLTRESFLSWDVFLFVFVYIYSIMKKTFIFLAVMLFSSVFSFAEEQLQTANTESQQSVTGWPRASFIMHAGFANVGLGAKIRFSQENGVYMTADLRYQVFQFKYIRIPVLFYFGGNNFHFIVGFTALNAVNAPTASGEMAAGLNVDLGRHWGIDALAFAPVGASDTGPSVLLDIRYAF